MVKWEWKGVGKEEVGERLWWTYGASSLCPLVQCCRNTATPVSSCEHFSQTELAGYFSGGARVVQYWPRLINADNGVSDSYPGPICVAELLTTRRCEAVPGTLKEI